MTINSASYPQFVDYILNVLENMGKQGDALSESTDLVVDVGLSSLQVMELIEQIEDHYDISIPLNILPDVRTIGDLARKLESLKLH